MTPDLIRSETLQSAGGTRHGFFGRCGGVSGGLYTSLNCSYSASDASEDVRENRARVVKALGGVCLITNRQVHGDRVRVVGSATDPDAMVEADGLVTTEPGVCIGALGADCAPVLFATRGIVGVAHAGWQGALAGITDAVIREMLRLGARVEDIVAAIGPAIQPPSYEVGDAFRTKLLSQSPVDASECFHNHPGTGNVHFDLPGYIERRLSHGGVRQIERSNIDTYTNASSYFSYRRVCHRGEEDYGR
jgi:YfiH family protein